MSDLKDLAWQAQSQSPPPELATLVHRSRTRLRRRRILTVATALAVVAVPATVVVNQLSEAGPDPAATETRPRTGRELAHSRYAELEKFIPLPGDRWVALWTACLERRPNDNPTDCWSTLAYRTGDGIEFTKPTQEGFDLRASGRSLYGIVYGQERPDPRLLTMEDGRPLVRKITASGSPRTIGSGLVLWLRGRLHVVDPRTGRARALELPADLKKAEHAQQDESGRWWLYPMSKLLAWTDDGGKTWIRRPNPPKSYVTYGASADGRTILLQHQWGEQAGWNVYQRSRDGGKTWEAHPEPKKRVLEFRAVFDDGSALVEDKRRTYLPGETAMTSLQRLAPDGTIGGELQTKYSLRDIESLGDLVSGVVEGPAITSPSPYPTATPTPLPPAPPPVLKVAVSKDRGVGWETFEPR